MKQSDLRRILALVDEKYIDELTEQDALAPKDEQPAVTRAEAPKRQAFWRALTAVAAAVVLLVPCGLLARQVWDRRVPVQDPVSPQTVVTEPVPSEEPTVPTEEGESQEPFASLADANAAEYPWQGKVIQAEQIGSMTFDGALRCRLHYPEHEGLRDAVHVVYKDPASDEHYAHIHYTRATISELTSDPNTAIPMEGLCTILIGSPQMENPENADGNSAFVVNCGNYRVSVVLCGGTRQELVELITAVSNGFHELSPDAVRLPEEPDVMDTTADDLTYAQAKLFAGEYLPDETLGWEDADNFMTLKSICYHQHVNDSPDIVGREIHKWLTLVYDGKNGPLELTIAEPGTLDAAGFADNVPVMDKTLWGAKTTDVEPYGRPVTEDRNGLYEYAFRCAFDRVEVMIRGTVDLNECGPFVDYYSIFVRGIGVTPTVGVALDEVNAQNVQWKGEVITAEIIGDLQFHRAELNQFRMTEDSPELTVYENLYYGASEAGEPGSDYITISYTNASPEQMYFDGRAVIQDAPDADAILTGEWYHTGNQRAFLLQREDYYIRVMISEDLPRETLQELIALLQ